MKTLLIIPAVIVLSQTAFAQSWAQTQAAMAKTNAFLAKQHEQILAAQARHDAAEQAKIDQGAAESERRAEEMQARINTAQRQRDAELNARSQAEAAAIRASAEKSAREGAIAAAQRAEQLADLRRNSQPIHGFLPGDHIVIREYALSWAYINGMEQEFNPSTFPMPGVIQRISKRPSNGEYVAQIGGGLWFSLDDLYFPAQP